MFKIFIQYLWHCWYNYISYLVFRHGDTAIFMNYGYETEPPVGLKIEPSDETNRYYIQLYNHVCKTVNFKNKKVLEISCGRGGGSDWVYRTYKPDSYIGLDLSENGIEWCKRKFERDTLSFIVGDALNLPFDENTFDIIINVEASHCYPNQSRFFNEVSRILKKDGIFLYADFRPNDTNIHIEQLSIHEKWIKAVSNSNCFTMISDSDITNGAYIGTLMNTDKHQNLVELLPYCIRWFGRYFSACEGTAINTGFKNRTICYTSFVLTNKK